MPVPVQKPPTVDEYVTSAPPEQRAELTKLRALIRKHLPHANETLGSSGFAVYADDDGKWLAGFAWRKKGPMLYVMNAAVLDQYAQQLGNLRSGKSCIDWRATKSMSMETLTKLADQILRDASGARG